MIRRMAPALAVRMDNIRRTGSLIGRGGRGTLPGGPIAHGTSVVAPFAPGLRPPTRTAMAQADGR